jgi:ATP-dependent protease ClpP protease subunit
MSAEESAAYGLVDKVLESRKQLPDAGGAITETKATEA